MKDFNKIIPDIPKLKTGVAAAGVFERSQLRPLMIPALIMFTSCCLTFLTGSKVPFIIISVLLVTACIFACLKRKTTLFFVALMSLILAFSGSFRILSVLDARSPDGSKELYTGIVVSCERKLSGSVKITAVFDGVRADLRTYGDIDLSNLTPGMTFKAYGKFKQPDPPGNPGEFDYQGYLKSKGILYVFNAESLQVSSVPAKPLKILFSFSDLCFNARKHLFERFTMGRNAEVKGLVAAVCLGDSSLSDERDIREFKLSGCSHLLAVSGTHFAGFLAVLPCVLSVLSPGRKKNSIIYMFFAFITGCITGWSESVTRSAFMSAAGFACKDTVSAMALSALVMMAADPFCSVRNGFLMSFSACIAIRLLSGRIFEMLSFMKKRKGLAMAVSAQAAAMIGIMPFSGITQTRYSLIQFAVQALGGFLAKSACMMFVPGCILSMLFKDAYSTFFSAPSTFFLELLKKTVTLGTSYSIKTASGRPFEPFFVLCLWAYISLKLMPGFAFKKMLLKVSSFFLAICTGFLIAGIVRPQRAEVIFADVGQGDCCLIVAGNRSCLIDCGTYEQGENKVISLLDYYGIDKVDAAFMTHWDQDHAGGLAALAEQGRIKSIYTGYTGSDQDTQAFEKSLVARSCDPLMFRRYLTFTKAGDEYLLSDNVKLKVIYPSSGFSGGNPGSLVILLDCCGTKMLFTGDIAFETEDALISKGLVSDVDILKVAHHGSRYSSGNSFLEKTRPEISVISAGKNNRYGHPSPYTLKRLENTGSRIYRTDRSGAVILSF